MRGFLLAVIAALVFAGSVSIAADKPPQEAQGIRTMFVDKGSARSVLKAINVLHAKMEADGWVYRDMSVYTEDGDLQGIFVTYTRPMTDAEPAMHKPATGQ
ncbi:MAG: hypothetical protein ABIQ86_07190 [Steroidobacteraceae bacterium]